MDCSDVSERLGLYLDGELPAEDTEAVRAHLNACERCRAQFEELQAVVHPLQAGGADQAPPELWEAIQARLDASQGTADPLSGARAARGVAGRGSSAVSGTGRPSRWKARPFLVAAAVLLPIGLGLVALQIVSPEVAQAEEAVIDFGPLLARIETNFEGAMDDFLKHHKARPIGLSEAGEYLELRVHPANPLPDGLVLKQTHLLTLGKRHGLLFRLAGPGGELVVSQCPEDVRQVHGGRDCVPCRVGSRFEGEVVHAGPWSLVHIPSKRGCVCILTTLDDDHLANVLEALEIEF